MTNNNRGKTAKDCETLIINFIKLKEIFIGISKNRHSILNGKIPDLKEIHRRLQKNQ